MSSTNEGNPPIAMKVKNAATNMSIDPLACKFWSRVIGLDFVNNNWRQPVFVSFLINYLNGAVREADFIEDSPNT